MLLVAGSYPRWLLAWWVWPKAFVLGSSCPLLADGQLKIEKQKGMEHGAGTAGWKAESSRLYRLPARAAKASALQEVALNWGSG